MYDFGKIEVVNLFFIISVMKKKEGKLINKRENKYEVIDLNWVE